MSTTNRTSAEILAILTERELSLQECSDLLIAATREKELAERRLRKAEDELTSAAVNHSKAHAVFARAAKANLKG